MESATEDRKCKGSEMEEYKTRDCMEILMHHIKAIAAGDVDEILTDYDDELIAFSYEDDGIQRVKGKREQRKQIELVCTKDGTPPDIEKGPLKITYMQGIGDYAALELHADPDDVFGAHTFISRNGKTLYNTSYHHQLHRFIDGEKPIRLGELSESGAHTREIAEAYVESLCKGDFKAAKRMREEKTLLLTNLKSRPFIGQEAVGAFLEEEWKHFRADKPHYIVDEAEGPIAFLVYKNEQGMTAETYLVEEDKIVFQSIIHRDGIF